MASSLGKVIAHHRLGEIEGQIELLPFESPAQHQPVDVVGQVLDRRVDDAVFSADDHELDLVFLRLVSNVGTPDPVGDVSDRSASVKVVAGRSRAEHSIPRSVQDVGEHVAVLHILTREAVPQLGNLFKLLFGAILNHLLRLKTHVLNRAVSLVPLAKLELAELDWQSVHVHSVEIGRGNLKRLALCEGPDASA